MMESVDRLSFEQTPVDSTKLQLFIKSVVWCNASRETRRPFSFVHQLKRMVRECDQVAHPLILVCAGCLVLLRVDKLIRGRYWLNQKFFQWTTKMIRNSVVRKSNSRSTCYVVLSARVTSNICRGARKLRRNHRTKKKETSKFVQTCSFRRKIHILKLYL